MPSSSGILSRLRLVAGPGIGDGTLVQPLFPERYEGAERSEAARAAKRVLGPQYSIIVRGGPTYLEMVRALQKAVLSIS